jgi:hypothetical protein
LFSNYWYQAQKPVQLLEQKKNVTGFQMVVSLHPKSYMQTGDRPVFHETIVEKLLYVFPGRTDLQLEFVYWNTEFHYSDVYTVCCWSQV